LDTGQTTSTLTATVSPNNATYKTVYWSTSNPNVVKVDDNGMITALRSGTATITASTVYGNSATCTVTVTGALVLLDLAAKLQTLPTQVIDTGAKFNTAFSGMLSPGGGVGTDVTYAIINDGGIKKLRVNEFALWGPGFDITNIVFEADDMIEVKGTYLSGGLSDGIQIQMVFVEPWTTFHRWYISPGNNFQQIFTITADDAATFNANGKIRLRTNGLEPWSGPDPNYPNGAGSFVIEQVKVRRP